MTLKCECGGTLRQVEIDRFDFSPLAGLPVELREVPGLRCDKCGGETLQGRLINAVLHLLTQEVLVLPRIFSPQEAKYLRKHLGWTQKDLATHMKTQRETVASWECGRKPMSPQNDYMLRGLVLCRRRTETNKAFPEHVRDLALGEVRSAVKTPTESKRFVFPDQLKLGRSGIRATFLEGADLRAASPEGADLAVVSPEGMRISVFGSYWSSSVVGRIGAVGGALTRTETQTKSMAAEETPAYGFSGEPLLVGGQGYGPVRHLAVEVLGFTERVRPPAIPSAGGTGPAIFDGVAPASPRDKGAQ